MKKHKVIEFVICNRRFHLPIEVVVSIMKEHGETDLSDKSILAYAYNTLNWEDIEDSVNEVQYRPPECKMNAAFVDAVKVLKEM